MFRPPPGALEAANLASASLATGGSLCFSVAPNLAHGVFGMSIGPPALKSSTQLPIYNNPWRDYAPVRKCLPKEVA